jgi:hypothetical protein
VQGLWPQLELKGEGGMVVHMTRQTGQPQPYPRQPWRRGLCHTGCAVRVRRSIFMRSGSVKAGTGGPHGMGLNFLCRLGLAYGLGGPHCRTRL